MENKIFKFKIKKFFDVFVSVIILYFAFDRLEYNYHNKIKLICNAFVVFVLVLFNIYNFFKLFNK
jgi:hypothetical protein